MRHSPKQKAALGFGAAMLAVVILMTPWAESVQGERVVLLGAWAPLWQPPSASAVVDWERLAVEVSLVVGVTTLAVWMLRD